MNKPYLLSVNFELGFSLTFLARILEILVRLSQGRRTAFVCGMANEVRKDELSESNAADFFLQFDFLKC